MASNAAVKFDQLDVIARQASDLAGHDVTCGQGSATSRNAATSTAA
jgi:hypothetical protein